MTSASDDHAAPPPFLPPGTATDHLIAGTERLDEGLERLRRGEDGVEDALAEARAHYALALQVAGMDRAASPLERVAALVGLADVAVARDDDTVAADYWRQALESMPHDPATLGALSKRMRATAERHGELGHNNRWSLANDLADQALDGHHLWTERQARRSYDDGVARFGRGDRLSGERFLNLARSGFLELSQGRSATRCGLSHLRIEGETGLALTAITLGERATASRHFDLLMEWIDASSLAGASSRFRAAGDACAARGDDAGAAQAWRFEAATLSPAAVHLEIAAGKARAQLHKGMEMLGVDHAKGAEAVAMAVEELRSLGRAVTRRDALANREANLEVALGLTVAAIAREEGVGAQDAWRDVKSLAPNRGKHDGWVRAWEVMDAAAVGFREAGRTQAARAAARFAHQCFPTNAVRQARAQAAFKRSGARG